MYWLSQPLPKCEVLAWSTLLNIYDSVSIYSFINKVGDYFIDFKTKHMSFANSFLPIQRNLLDYTMDTKNIDGLLALLAARSRNSSISDTDNGSAGKLRDLKLNIIPPSCVDESDEIGNVCEVGDVIEPSQIYFRIERQTTSKVLTLNKDDIRDLDGNITFSDYAQSMIKSHLPAVRDKLHRQALTVLLGQTGLIPLPDGESGLSELKVPYTDPANGSINPLGYDTIMRTYVDSGYTNPIIIGGNSVYNWKAARKRAADNNNWGQALSKLETGENMFYDPMVNEIYADDTQDHIFSFDPQMVKFVSFSKNAGIFATDYDSVTDIENLYSKSLNGTINGSLLDPRTGLLWDFNLKYDDCEERWNFVWYLLWDIYFMPPMVCNIQGVNSLFHFTTCLPAEVECGTPQSLSPVSDDTAYSFDTDGEIDYDYFIQTLQSGNLEKDYDGLNEISNITELAALLNDFLAPSGIQLTVDGTTLNYTGTGAITININGGAVLSPEGGGLTFTFA